MAEGAASAGRGCRGERKKRPQKDGLFFPVEINRTVVDSPKGARGGDKKDGVLFLAKREKTRRKSSLVFIGNRSAAVQGTAGKRRGKEPSGGLASSKGGGKKFPRTVEEETIDRTEYSI